MLILGRLQLKFQTLIAFVYVVQMMCRVHWNHHDFAKLKCIDSTIANTENHAHSYYVGFGFTHLTFY